MSQVEVSKLNELLAIGPDSDEAAVAKLSMLVLLTPGDDGGELPTRQAHVYAQIIGG